MIDLEPLRNYICTHFLFDPDAPLPDGRELFPNLIDSLGVMELVDMVEKIYGVELQDDELLMDNFRNLAAIAAMLERKLS